MCDSAERRAALKELRRRTRQAHTTVQQALTDWGRATADGRALLTDLSNDALTLRYLPHHALGPLTAIPRLLEAGQRKLESRIALRTDDLRSCLHRLRKAHEALAAAAESVEQAGAACPDQPVFQCLSAAGVARLLRGIADMHLRQHQVCEQIVAALPSVAGAQLGAGKRTLHEARQLENVLQAALATWMLQTRIDAGQVDSVVELMRDDMKGF